MRNPPYGMPNIAPIGTGKIDLSGLKPVEPNLARPSNASASGSKEFFFNLANISVPTPVNFGSTKARRITLARNGTTAGALLILDMGGGGKITLYPGESYEGNIDSFSIYRSYYGAITGYARVIIDFNDDNKLVLANGEKNTILTATAFSLQTLNSTANIPSLATDGIDISNACAFNCFFDSATGTTATGGTIVIWRYDPLIGVWAETELQYSVVVGRRYFQVPDVAILVPRGRLFAELRSITNNLGVGEPGMSLYAYGYGPNVITNG